MRADDATIRRALFAFDSHGLLHDGHAIDEPHKRALAVSREVLIKLGLDPYGNPSPVEVIEAVNGKAAVDGGSPQFRRHAPPKALVGSDGIRSWRRR